MISYEESQGLARSIAFVAVANAYLLGLDLRSICIDEEVGTVRKFLAIVSDDTKPAWLGFVKAAPQSTG